MGSGGGSPHGFDLGFLKCVAKDPVGDEQVNVRFEGEHGSASFLLGADDANYFKVDENYLFRATKP